MKRKQLILVFLIALQTIIGATAVAWSPLDGVESAVKRMQHCYFVSAGSEDEEEAGEEEEEDEEPECD